MARALIVLLLAGLTLGVVPLAGASPADQTWIAGLYDAGDHDDAVLAALGIDGLVVADPHPGRGGTEPTDVLVIPPPRDEAVHARPSLQDRSPPRA